MLRSKNNVLEEELCAWQSDWEHKAVYRVSDISGDICVRLDKCILNGSTTLHVMLQQIEWIRLVKMLPQIEEAALKGEHCVLHLGDDKFVSVDSNRNIDISHFERKHALLVKTYYGLTISWCQFQEFKEQLQSLYFSLL
jgi:hypothetical protein